MHNLSYIISAGAREPRDGETSLLAEKLRRTWADRSQRTVLPENLRTHVLHLLFDPPGPGWAGEVEALFAGWEADRQANGPDLTDLVRIGVDRFGIDPHDVYAQAAGIAALLGETGTSLEFHNAVHHRKVLFHGLRLMEENNRMFEDDPRCALAPEEIVISIISICIHDLMHDGHGNGHGGAYVPGRLEQRAFDCARPWLHAAGLDIEDLLDIEAILLTTEVTPIGDPASPARQMRDAYAFHFQNAEACELAGKLTRLQGRRDLARIGMLVHAADVANSAGVSEAMSRHETTLFLKECGVESPLSDVLPAFLEGIGTVLEQFEPACSLYNSTRLDILEKSARQTLYMNS